MLQEVEDEAKWEEASSGREEAVFGAGVHEDPRGGFRPEGVGGAAQRDRPQRMARQQQWVSGGSVLSAPAVLKGVGCVLGLHLLRLSKWCLVFLTIHYSGSDFFVLCCVFKP